MLSAFTAVVYDLWQFVLGIDTSHKPTSVSVTSPVIPHYGVTEPSNPAVPLMLTSTPIHPLLMAKPESATLPVEIDSALSVSSLTDTIQKAEPLPEPGVTLYVVEPRGVGLLTAPYQQFDGVICTVPFGQSVTIKSYSGRYAEVLVRGMVGYLPKVSISTQKEVVYPNLKSGTVYGAEHVATRSIRYLIDDTFSGAVVALPLQAGEYITYRLRLDQVQIPWGQVRPRTPGLWHSLLRGITGIHTGVVAKTDTIMEWYADDGDGRLAYVEAVLPDQTLRVSGVGIAVAGEYSLLTLPPTVWKEWRPVFIMITM